MKRLFIILIGLISIYTSVSAQQRPIFQKIIQNRLSKNASKTTGPATDYSRLYYWAASPQKHNYSDSIPAFLKSEIKDSSADVFYIHPTTFISNIQTSAWNADLRDTAL